MCGGGGGDQTVTQKTELDPAMRRLLYGGTAANPRGGFGSTGAAAAGTPGANGANGGDNTGAMTVDEQAAMYPSVNTPVGPPLDATGIGSPDYGSQPAPNTGTPFTGSGGLYAMGGPVMPQQGLASLNQGQMPMMGGQMPNLSDPMTAATLAMAVRRPELQYGAIMGQPMQGYAMGGYIEGPGTGTSDSIPATIYQNGRPVGDAALSNGEFVMTEAAVNGAGGAAQMYRMMHDLEKKDTA
jgi:hypothetical protein